MRSIKKLVTNNIITVSETELGTLFTIVKYESYQEFSSNHENRTQNGRRTYRRTKTERKRYEVGTISRIKEFKN
ncbi:hypothetical protein BsIDN1_46070 [Bacillus safensis]|uniref:Uncharacterized protein n=1 Tax=Bacillus safensis TaxID=561879 RepID=A0A5S9MGP8_BACIA|nr:hypothetical protein BsIDN1_46070 [Bacillus safensis]